MNWQALLDRTPRQWLDAATSRVRRRTPVAGFDDSHPCVYVLSTGRSGTQTLAALFRSDANVASYHEPLPLLYGLSTFAYRHRRDPSLEAPIGELFRAARDDLMQSALRSGRGYFETSPQGTFVAHSIAAAIEGSRFIHLTRDPLAVIRSGMRRRWYDGHPYDRHRITPEPDSPDADWWDKASPLAKNAWLWNETNRFIAELVADLEPSRCLRLRSEDVFAGVPGQIEDVARFVGARTPSTARVDRTLRKRLNAQESGEFPAPAEWPDEWRAEVADIVGETAAGLRYPGV